MSGVAYPVLADSVWGAGGAGGAGFLHMFFHTLEGHSFYDYAGGGVVHLAGGMAALAGNLLLGRRILQPVKDLQAGVKEKETWQRRYDNPEAGLYS